MRAFSSSRLKKNLKVGFFKKDDESGSKKEKSGSSSPLKTLECLMLSARFPAVSTQIPANMIFSNTDKKITFISLEENCLLSLEDNGWVFTVEFERLVKRGVVDIAN